MSAATATAVSASISTPVRPVTRQVARITTQPCSGSGSSSTVTAVSGSGWQSGIRSAVRLAPMMPASCATPSTSPFLKPRAAIRARVSGAIVDAALGRGRALGDVLAADVDHDGVAGGVEVGEAGHAASARPSRRRVAAVTSASRIRLSPTRKARAPAAAIRDEIGVAVEPALGDQQPVARRARRQALEGGEVDRQRLQVAVVDAEQRARQAQRAVELGLVVHLDQDVHAELGARQRPARAPRRRRGRP